MLNRCEREPTICADPFFLLLLFVRRLQLMLSPTLVPPTKPPSGRPTADWAKAAATRDVDATVALHSDDATVLPQNLPVANNKKAIRDLWAARLGAELCVDLTGSRPKWKLPNRRLDYLTGTYDPKIGKTPRAIPRRKTARWSKSGKNKPTANGNASRHLQTPTRLYLFLPQQNKLIGDRPP